MVMKFIKLSVRKYGEVCDEDDDQNQVQSCFFKLKAVHCCTWALHTSQ